MAHVLTGQAPHMMEKNPTVNMKAVGTTGPFGVNKWITQRILRIRGVF